MPLGNADTEVTDNEGFAANAPAPARPAEPITREDAGEMLGTRNDPKAALDQYMSAAYPPKIIAIDLEAMKVVGSHGKFDLEEEEKRQVIAISVRCMQRAYEKILQTLVQEAGLDVQETAGEGGDVPTQQHQEGNSAKSVRTTRNSSIKSGGTTEK